MNNFCWTPGSLAETIGNEAEEHNRQATLCFGGAAFEHHARQATKLMAWAVTRWNNYFG